MATINFRLHSKDQNKVTPVYCLVSLNRTQRYEVKTGYFILTKDWSATTKLPKQNSEENKNLHSKLSKLTPFLFEKINSLGEKGQEPSKNWVLDCIAEFKGEKKTNESEFIVNHIQHIIDTAHTRPNQKGSIGLAKSTVSKYETFLGIIIKYEEHLNKKIYIRDIDLKFIEKFKTWMFSLQYSINYIGIGIALLKAVCNDADKQGIEISPQLKNVKTISESKAPEEIIYLSFEELKKIEDLKILSPYLENVRNWLILGCYLGQRESDLMKVNKTLIKEVKGVKIIELRQEKTGKLMAIPLLPKALHILETKNIHPITLSKFNDYAKKVCKLAGIDTPIQGKKTNPETGKKVKGVYPKYELISSHVCRRSFASNFYGDIPTPVLINITGHSSESMFLKYIGKTSYDNAFAMIEHFTKFEQKKQEQPKLKVLRQGQS